MQTRSRFLPNPKSLYQRLNDEAQRLRKEARGTQPGVARERLIREARQAETASHIDKWLSSSELQARDNGQMSRLRFGKRETSGSFS